MKDLKPNDKSYLERCLELAKEAVKAGDQGFGSVLVNQDGKIIAEARNRANEKTALAHPEYELAHWALKNMARQDRQNATMYTTGEHCPMCSGAHGYAEIGTLVYLSSARQLAEWSEELNIPDSPNYPIPVEKVIKEVEVRGPGKGEMLNKIKALHKRRFQGK